MADTRIDAYQHKTFKGRGRVRDGNTPRKLAEKGDRIDFTVYDPATREVVVTLSSGTDISLGDDGSYRVVIGADRMTMADGRYAYESQLTTVDGEKHPVAGGDFYVHYSPNR